MEKGVRKGKGWRGREEGRPIVVKSWRLWNTLGKSISAHRQIAWKSPVIKFSYSELASRTKFINFSLILATFTE